MSRSALELRYFALSGTNIGGGQGLIQSINPTNNINLKSLVAGSNISLSANSETILINASSGTSYYDLDTKATTVNPYSFYSNTTLKAQGQVTLTNGSSAVVGVGTNFTDATAPTGLGFWFSFWVKDSDNNWYRIDLASITNATSATISRSHTRTLIRQGSFNTSGNGSVPAVPSTFQGVTGTYDYYLGYMNWSDGLFSVAMGNSSYADNYSIAIGGGATAIGASSISLNQQSFSSGQNALAIGAQTRAIGTGAVAIGYRAEATANFAVAIGTSSLASGNGSFAGGRGFDAAGSASDRYVIASGQGSINLSENSSLQTLNHGARAQGSAIIGGLNHDIPSNSTRSAIVGGNTIKASSATTDTVFMPKVRIGLGTGGSLTTNNSNNNIVVRNSTTGELELRTAASLTGSSNVTANNGLTKIGDNIVLGGILTGNTVLDIDNSSIDIIGAFGDINFTTSGSFLGDFGYAQIDSGGGIYLNDNGGGGIGLSSFDGGGIIIGAQDNSIDMTVTDTNQIGQINQFRVVQISNLGVTHTIKNTNTGEANTVTPIMYLAKTHSNATLGQNGNGLKILFNVKNAKVNDSTTPNVGLSYILTNATVDAEDSKYTFEVVSGGSEQNILDIDKFGAKYYGNYHSNYTNRSLVDKEYVDSLVTGGTLNGSINTGEVAFGSGLNTITGTSKFTYLSDIISLSRNDSTALGGSLLGMTNTSTSAGSAVGLDYFVTNPSNVPIGAFTKLINTGYLLTQVILTGTTGGIGFYLGNPATPRFVIENAGEWKVNGLAGSSGQVLTSNGSGSSPTWQTVSGGSTGLLGTVNYIPRFTGTTSLGDSQIFDSGGTTVSIGNVSSLLSGMKFAVQGGITSNVIHSSTNGTSLQMIPFGSGSVGQPISASTKYTRLSAFESDRLTISCTTGGTSGGAVGIGIHISRNGGVSIGNFTTLPPTTTLGRLDCANDVVAFSSSDIRLKENVKNIDNALDKVLSLDGVEFDWKKELKDAHGYDQHDVGIIAQQIQEVLPEAVRTNDTGYLAVRYEKIVPLLIEAIKEQQKMINELKELLTKK